MFEKLYFRTAAIFSKYVVEQTRSLLHQGGMEKIHPRVYLGFSVYTAVVVALIVFFTSPFFLVSQPGWAYWAVSIASALLVGVLFYLNLILSAENKAAKVEAILPDMLQIISANIRAGMTLENAIWSSAKEEFGPLRDEVKKVSADAFSGVPVQEGLLNMSKRIRSTMTERAIKLVVEGIAKGGEMTKLLDQVAWDVKSIQALKREIATTTLTYSIFIVFAAVIVSPLLFSVSVYYAEMSEKISEKTTSAPELNMSKQGQGGSFGYSSIPVVGFGQQKQTINSGNIRLFAYAAITLTAIFSSLILGTIRTGKASSGLKFMILFALIGVTMFSLAHDFLATAFATIVQ